MGGATNDKGLLRLAIANVLQKQTDTFQKSLMIKEMYYHASSDLHGDAEIAKMVLPMVPSVYQSLP